MSVLMTAASLLVSLILGVLMTLVLFPSPPPWKTAGLLFRYFAGGSLGIGLTACIHFLCLLTGLRGITAPADLAACLFFGSILMIQYRKRRLRKEPDVPQERPPSAPRAALPGQGEQGKKPGPPRNALPAWKGSPLEVLTIAVFSIALASSLISWAVAFLKEPHGRWDAFLIWNLHARFLFRGGEAWREAFASGLDWSHWDYPLLLPLSIARGWAYAGSETTHFPAVMAFLFTFLLLGLLLTSLFLLRDAITGCLGALLLMGAPFFIYMGTSQFADIPLALFILTTLILLFLQAESPDHRPGAVILAGIAAGLSAWTKNEGLLFFLIAAGSLICTTAYFRGWASSLRRTVWFLAGAMPILLIVLYFKVALAPTNDLVAGFSLSALAEKLFDPSRYGQIARAFFVTGISFTQGSFDMRTGMQLQLGPVNILLPAAYLLITGTRITPREKAGLVQAASVLLLMTVGYFFVYVVTPRDLYYHLMTSLNRLFLQLWPGVLFVVFLIARPLQVSFPGEGLKSVPPIAEPRQGQKRKTKMKEAK